MITLLDSSLNSFISLISLFVILVILLGLVLKKLHQPSIIAYILVGIILGKDGLGIIKDTEAIYHLGEIGIILLLFFIGMEISLPEFIKQWRVAVVGTFLQVMISLGVMLGIGYIFDWSLARSVVLGFVIALSSSAVIIKMLQEKGMVDKKVGKYVLSILLTQDIILVPLLIITSFMGGKEVPMSELLLMVLGGILVILAMVYVYIKKEVKLPFAKAIEADHEIQVFTALLFCFGGALISALFGLSPALGAFVGGIVMHAGKATEWIHDTLDSFRVLFVAFFFVSVGLQIDFEFLAENWLALSVVTFAVFVTNHFVNMAILRVFSCSWKEAFIGGALLAQIGELSFLLGFEAFSLHIITDFGYKFSICLISITLLISPFWITFAEKLVRYVPKSE